MAGRKDRTGDAVIRLRDAVHRAARAFPGIRGDMTIDRMFVASWRDWFPTPGRIDPSFFTLDASRPNGDNPDRWQPASILDPIDVPFDSEDPDWLASLLALVGITIAVSASQMVLVRIITALLVAVVGVVLLARLITMHSKADLRRRRARVWLRAFEDGLRH